MVDPEIVMERIVINPNDLYPSYFGAPAIRHQANNGLTAERKIPENGMY
jgi:hypothetical protein